MGSTTAYEMAGKACPVETLDCLQDLLRTRADSQPPRGLTFYSLGNTSTPTSVTYRDLYGLAQENSKILSSLASFREGSPVLIHLHDHWDVILWFWSTILADGLPVLSTPFSNVDEHRHRHVQALSTLLESPICITRDEYLPLFRGTGHTLRLETIEALPSTAASGGDDAAAEPARATVRSRRPHHADGRGEAPAMLMLTSGSTGSAKAVVLTHRQVLASAAGKAAARALPPGRPFLNWIGLDHVGAFVEIHVHALWAGEDQVHAQAADVVPSPTTLLDLLSRHRVSRSFAPNFFLASLVPAAAAAATAAATAAGGAGAWDLSSLTFLVSGGEANDVRTCAAASALLERHGARRGVIAPGFGMTETCAGSIYNVDCPEYDLASGYEVASLGKCIEGMEMRVTVGRRSEDGRALAGLEDEDPPVLAQPGEPGDLEVRGEVVFKRYYRNPAATADAFTRDGWFRTGDRAVLDPGGNLCLVGRAKEVINIHGVKVATADVQSSLERASGGCNLDRLVVFPSRAAHTEQVTVACLERRAPPMTAGDKCEVEDRLVQACMMVTASRPVVFSPGPGSLRLLPATTLGKISRAKMQSLFESGAFEADVARWRSTVREARLSRRADGGREGEDRDAAATADERDLVEDFMRISNSNGAARTVPVRLDTSLWELGCTSMDIVRLKHAIDARLGLFIPVIMLMKNPTARSLAAAISRLRTRATDGGATDGGAPDGGTKSTGGKETTTTTPTPTPSAGEGGGDYDAAAADNQNDYDPVVAFRTSGRRTPLWLVHPGVGEVLVFAGLARQLSDDDRPLYALRARGLEPGEARFGSVGEAAGAYAAAVRRVQPRGPYALAGYSYGAMLAFEMAKRLEEDGGGGGGGAADVRFLGSFNLPPHIKARMRQLSWNMCFLHLAYFIGLIGEREFDAAGGGGGGGGGDEEEEDFRTLARGAALARVLGAADRARMAELSLGEAELARWADVSFGLQSMAVDYEPAGTVESIHVFHAEPLKVVAASREEWLGGHLARWADFCRSDPVFSQVGGAHYTMLGPDHVAGFAQKLKGALRARGL